MKLYRPSFDAACAALAGTPDALSPSQCAALWNTLVPDAAQTREGRQRWTAVALALREPLRREIKLAIEQASRGRFDGLVAQAPGKDAVALTLVHARYAERLEDIRLRMDTALRREGHFCVPGDESFAQPLRVIVANERAADRPAGNTDWTQWEDPVIRRRITAAFEAGLATQKARTQWSPYLPHGTRLPGAAAAKRGMKEWRGAFHDAIVAFDMGSNTSGLASLTATLRSPLMQQHIEDAIREQLKLHRGPRNRAFTDRACTIWHALHPDVRVDLAARFDAALDGPARITTPNPFELTDADAARLTGVK